MKKLETSKKILWASWIAVALLTGITIYGAFIGIDSTNLTTIAGMAWAELTAAHGFYYWKAKNENRAKGTQKLVKDFAKQYDIEAAARFAEIIYKD